LLKSQTYRPVLAVKSERAKPRSRPTERPAAALDRCARRGGKPSGNPAQSIGQFNMNAKRATQILQCLVQGIDPLSGQELPADGVLQKAEVLRALLSGVSALEERAAREARRAALPANVGTPWTAEEERRLVEAFQAGDALSLVAEKLGRTLRAIESRLERLGLLTKDQRVTESSFGSND
jgi:hypothetical protein